MSISYGFGLGALLDELSDADKVDVCARFARLGLTRCFHEVIGGRVARFAGDAPVTWLGDDEARPILAAFDAGGGSVSSSYDAHFEETCGLILPELVVEVDTVALPGTPLDGLAVSDAAGVLDETREYLEEAAADDDGDESWRRELEYAIEVRTRFAAAWRLGVEHALIWSLHELLRG